ncbi:MAG: LacI family DNA-binding transcriptional regulator [Clostridia bacterium]|nr:LacI family DNA-binding transcriptional regulator [Clostridia bacterium]
MAKEKTRVTLQDIARATGYTVNTVSRALKNKDDISRETCEKIQQVAKDMGYVRNYIASSLRSGRTKTIAVITGTMVNPYYAILCDMLQLEAVRLGYGLMILSAQDNQETEMQMVEMALSRQVDGIMITPSSSQSPALDLLRSSGLPYVLLSRSLDCEDDDYVVCNDYQGGYLAAEHLIEHGHRDLAMLSFRHVVFSTKNRFEGFHQACVDHGIGEDHIYYAEPEGEKAILKQVHAWCECGVTGLFSFCDVEAWYLKTMLENSPLRAERPLSIVGFDNILGYMNFLPPICTVDAQLKKEAEVAIELLRNRIHDAALPPQHVVLPVHIVCRGSCGMEDSGQLPPEKVLHLKDA